MAAWQKSVQHQANRANPPELFKSIYSAEDKEGIRITVHAGKEANVSYMRGALEHPHVQRFDHGIKLAEDPELLAEFARRMILITMCPISNVKPRCVKGIQDVPTRLYLDEGIKFPNKSDGRAYLVAYVLDNYWAVQESFRLTEEWIAIVAASIEGGWCSQGRKSEMLAMLGSTLSNTGDLMEAQTTSRTCFKQDVAGSDVASDESIKSPVTQKLYDSPNRCISYMYSIVRLRNHGQLLHVVYPRRNGHDQAYGLRKYHYRLYMSVSPQLVCYQALAEAK